MTDTAWHSTKSPSQCYKNEQMTVGKSWIKEISLLIYRWYGYLILKKWTIRANKRA